MTEGKIGVVLKSEVLLPLPVPWEVLSAAAGRDVFMNHREEQQANREKPE